MVRGLAASTASTRAFWSPGRSRAKGDHSLRPRWAEAAPITTTAASGAGRQSGGLPPCCRRAGEGPRRRTPKRSALVSLRANVLDLDRIAPPSDELGGGDPARRQRAPDVHGIDRTRGGFVDHNLAFQQQPSRRRRSDRELIGARLARARTSRSTSARPALGRGCSSRPWRRSLPIWRSGEAR